MFDKESFVSEALPLVAAVLMIALPAIAFAI